MYRFESNIDGEIDQELCDVCASKKSLSGCALEDGRARGILIELDLRYPHVIHGYTALDVSSHHKFAHETIAQNIIQELQCLGYDGKPESGKAKAPGAYLIEQMRPFRVQYASVRKSMQQRISHVAKECGFEIPLSWDRFTDENHSKLERLLKAELEASKFETEASNILSDKNGPNESKFRRLELSIADIESKVFEDCGLASGFDGHLERVSMAYYLFELSRASVCLSFGAKHKLRERFEGALNFQ